NALREGRQRGLKVICIDPRETEVARRADLHLQVRPGHDAAIVAAMLQVILSEERHDQAFCAEHVANLDTLQALLAPFTPARVAPAAGIDASQIVEAARLFAAGPRGTAVTGTGPEMGPHPNLLQHLVQTLNAVCGRYCRAGERMPNPGVLTPPGPRFAQASGPQRSWLEDGVRSRVSPEIGETLVLTPYGPRPEMPTAIISDEILTPGDGQIRALLCVGGNPLLAWPDQAKTHAALQSLDLLVCVDLRMSATAQLADYVLAPKHCLEREDVTLLTDIWHDQPYSQYTHSVLDASGDKIEEWELFWELARRLGLDLATDNGPIDMQEKPSKLELLENITRGSRVPVREIAAREGGHIYPVPDIILSPADPASAERLELVPDGLEDELQAAFADLDAASSADFPLLLISRRMKNTYNSTGPELAQLGRKGTTNPAHLHPSELQARGIADGEIIQVRSAHGVIPAVAAASEDVRPGVISMSHCWGGSPDPAQQADARVRDIGANTNRLINNLENAERYSGIPRQSCIPVSIDRLPA
ncbi:MAG: molybdopterin-dependent oxidoreductase, partial [Halioglobus sp.]|nr:molybdopterin-dependent oxidoreductase [Halioglobus sp.]